MIKTYLNFGSTHKRYQLIQKNKICGLMKEEMVEMDGYGMYKTKPMIEVSILTFTKISNPSLTIMVPIFGN